MQSSRRPILAFLVLLSLCACQCAFVFVRLLVPRGDPGWDAAHHSMLGLMMYSDIMHQRWISFAFDTYRQVYWPFLHSWFLAVSMVIFGPTLAAARGVSLMAYALSAVLLGLLGYRLVPERSFLRGIVAVWLWLTAAGFVQAFAVEALTESLAIAMTLASLLALERACANKSGRAFAWAGIWAMATYFTKTDYGILVIAATLLVLASTAWQSRLPDDLVRLRLYLTPVLILSFLWFVYLPKIPATISALTNFPYGPPRWSIPGVLYHFRELMRWSDSFWLFVILIACFLWSWRSGKSAVMKVILAYISISLVLHTISQTKDPKHIVKLLPLFFLLAGFQVERVWNAIRRPSLGKKAQWVFAAVLIVAAISRLTMFLQSTRAAQQLGTERVTALLCERLESQPSSLLLGQFAEISPYAITWKLASRSGSASKVPFDIKKDLFISSLGRLSQRHPWISFFERADSVPAFRVSYSPTKHREVLRPDILLDSLMTASAPDRVIVLEIESGSAWSTNDYDLFVYPGEVFLAALANKSSYRQSEAITFRTEGIKMSVFDRSDGQTSRTLPERSLASPTAQTAISGDR